MRGVQTASGTYQSWGRRVPRIRHVALSTRLDTVCHHQVSLDIQEYMSKVAGLVHHVLLLPPSMFGLLFFVGHVYG